MDILINVGLPVSLAIIMLSLGVGLEVEDFRRVARRRFAFAIGALSQVVLLPVVTFAVTLAFGLPPEIAVGFMLLSFCPGGVTSNILTKLARGDVALSVSLTAVISLLSILTVPVLAAWSVAYFLGETGPRVNITSLAFAMFMITTLPVALGVTTRAMFPGFAERINTPLARLAVVLFMLIVIAALAGNWQLFLDNLPIMGLALVALILLLMGLGAGLARVAGLTVLEMRTISIETGIQNSTLGITLAALITGVSDGFSTLALPSAVYGILMYVVALPVIGLMRRHRGDAHATG